MAVPASIKPLMNFPAPLFTDRPIEAAAMPEGKPPFYQRLLAAPN
jgi:hypothetical protein